MVEKIEPRHWNGRRWTADFVELHETQASAGASAAYLRRSYGRGSGVEVRMAKREVRAFGVTAAVYVVVARRRAPGGEPSSKEA